MKIHKSIVHISRIDSIPVMKIHKSVIVHIRRISILHVWAAHEGDTSMQSILFLRGQGY